MSTGRSDDPAMTATVDARGRLLPAAARESLGRYRLERVLGSGGMGVVHAAFDIDLERRVAIKLLHAEPGHGSRARLLREARAMARLDHPNVVKIYEVDSIDGVDFVVMELVDGSSLLEWLREAPHSAHEITAAFVAAGRGLAAAHAVGMVHRDFKPHNVLRGTRGEIKVGDFGLARDIDTPDDAAEPESARPGRLAGITMTGAIVGTPAYMAPEQWASGTISPAADQFAFCVALWEALAGARPFSGDTAAALQQAIEAGPAALDTTVLPRRLRAVIVRGLAVDPAKRWPSLEPLLAAIAPTPRARRWLVPGGIALVAAGIATATVMSGHGRNAPPDEPSVFVPKSRDELLSSVVAIDAAHYRVPRATVEQVLRDRTELEDGARALPAMQDDRVIGFRLYAVRPHSLYAALGFHDRDVIRTIDELPLTSDANVLAAFKRARTASSLEIAFDRDGALQRIAIAIVP